MTLVAELIANVDAAVQSYARAAFAAVAAAAAPLVLSGGALILAWWGVLLASGRSQAPMAEILERIAKIAVFAGLVGGTTGAFDILYGWFNAVPEGLGAVLIGGRRPAEALDGFYQEGMLLAQTLFAKFELSGTGLTWLVAGALVWLGVAILTGYGAFLIVLAKVAVAVLLGVAPLFLFLGMFQATRSWMEGWLRGLLTQSLLLTFTYGFLAFLLFVTQDFVGRVEAAQGAGADVAFSDVGAVLLVVVVGVLLLTQAGVLASAVGGGAAVGAIGAFGAAFRYLGGRLDAAASHARFGRLDVGQGYQRLRNALGGRPQPGGRDDWAQPVSAADHRARRFATAPRGFKASTS